MKFELDSFSILLLLGKQHLLKYTGVEKLKRKKNNVVNTVMIMNTR
jgi:hypothetical protein